MPATLNVRTGQDLSKLSLQQLRDAQSSAGAIAESIARRANEGGQLDQRDQQTWDEALTLVEAARAELAVRGQLERTADLMSPEGQRSGDRAGVPSPSPAPISRGEDTPAAVGMPELLTRSDSLAAKWRSRPDAEYRSEHEGLNLTKIVRGVVLARWDGAEAEQRAMSEGVGSAGGYVVPSTLAAAVLDLARAKSRCIEAGASTVTMDTPTLKVPMLAEDLEGTWRGENQLINVDQPGFSVVTMESKTYASLTLISRELFEDTESTITDAVKASASASMALAFDYAGLYGTGGPIEPLGLKNWDIGGPFEVSKSPLGSGNGATPADFDFLVDGIGELWDRNHEASGILLAPRSEVTMAKFKDQQDQPLQAPDMVRAVPRYPTNQVPKNLTVGSSNDCSDVFIGDWKHLVFGVRRSSMLMTLDQRYADYGQIGLLLWFRGDTAVLRPDAFEIITGVRA